MTASRRVRFFTSINVFMRCDFIGPLNVGPEEMVTVDRLVDFVLTVVIKALTKVHIEGPTGVRGRKSDNQMISEKMNWVPRHLLRDGLQPTYARILSQFEAARAVS